MPEGDSRASEPPAVAGLRALLAAHPDTAAFMRVHRPALVRRRAIVALERHGLGQLRVVRRDGTRVPISRARQAAVATAFREGT